MRSNNPEIQMRRNNVLAAGVVVGVVMAIGVFVADVSHILIAYFAGVRFLLKPACERYDEVRGGTQ